MSSLVFPVLKGLTFDGNRTPIWKTNAQEALSGKESRIGYQQYPLYQWEASYDILDDSAATSDLKALLGLFNAMKGSYDTFLYTDPLYSSVTDERFGTGDGSTTAFQVTTTFQNSGGPGGAECVQNFNGTPVIKKAGVTQTSPTNYTLGPTGIVTFVTAPTSGQALTWTGSFYYRCRFVSDTQDFSEFMSDWWATKRLRFKSVIL
jgi:uncharacterized protein (TIGR02217 family)